MRHLLYVIAIVFLVLWAIGAFVFAVGKIIHLLLILAIISVLIKRLRYSGRKQIQDADSNNPGKPL